MKVLVVKLSSLGDVIHTLPALTDAAAALPASGFDWVVEEAFAEVPAWHPAVDRVLPVAIRRWRRRPLRDFTGPEWRQARAALRTRAYDAVIDAQGLIKSALVTRLARGPRFGPDRRSAREGLASLAYDRGLPLPRDLHAVQRTRLLFARALGYPLPAGPPDYGLRGRLQPESGPTPRDLLFFHGTARAEKLWPEEHWRELTRLAAARDFRVGLPWGNAAERERAQRIAVGCADVAALPPLDLTALAGRLLRARGAVAVDTGLAHLAAALAVPGVTLYGPTSPRLVGTLGPNQVHLRLTGALAELSAAAVWQALEALLAEAG